MIRGIVVSIFLLFCLIGQAQEVWMHSNEGQWDDRIEFKVELQMGELLIEKDGFTFNLTDIKQKKGDILMERSRIMKMKSYLM